MHWEIIEKMIKWQQATRLTTTSVETSLKHASSENSRNDRTKWTLWNNARKTYHASRVSAKRTRKNEKEGKKKISETITEYVYVVRSVENFVSQTRAASFNLAENKNLADGSGRRPSFPNPLRFFNMIRYCLATIKGENLDFNYTFDQTPLNPLPPPNFASAPKR